MTTKICPWCEMPFQVKHIKQKFCCAEHRQLYDKNMRRFRNMLSEKEPRYCVICGKPIINRGHAAITCSEACSKINSSSTKGPVRNYTLPKKEPKKVMSFPERQPELEKEAHDLGMSYGEIQTAYYAGNLQEAVNRKKNELHGDHIYESHIGGKGNGPKTTLG